MPMQYVSDSTSDRNGQLGIDPSMTFPTEIVAEIFECCLPTDSERLKTPLPRLAPLVLTWVCRTWRSLCLALPTLWVQFTIGHRGSDPEEDTRLLKLWLSRSVYLPVTLKLNYELDDELHPIISHSDREKRHSDSMAKLLQTAISCIERWSTFEIHTLDVSVLDQVFLAIVTRGSTCLRNLSFSTKYLGFFGDIHLLDFSLCPALKSICVRSPMIFPVSQSVVMKNMTRLELRFCSSVEDCLRWIEICPALEELIVRLFCSNLDDLGDELERLALQRSHHLSYLKYLEVHCFSTELDAGPLLDVLETPALRSFAINMYDLIESPRRWTHVLDLLRRSEPPLETLKVLGTPMIMEDIVECLRLLPRITQLSIGASRNTDMLLKSLSATRDFNATPEERQMPPPDALCPSLKVLDLVNCTWSCDVLASIASSRCLISDPRSGIDEAYVAPLEVLRLDIENAPKAKQNPVLIQCMARGLNIVACEKDLLILAFDSPDVVFV